MDKHNDDTLDFFSDFQIVFRFFFSDLIFIMFSYFSWFFHFFYLGFFPDSWIFSLSFDFL